LLRAGVATGSTAFGTAGGLMLPLPLRRRRSCRSAAQGCERTSASSHDARCTGKWGCRPMAASKGKGQHRRRDDLRSASPL